MKYRRVIPRDLFNEANLLKCLGQAALLILDGKSPDGLELTHRHAQTDFLVEMDPGDGSIYCTNISLKSAKGTKVTPRRPCNSREPWPLYIVVYEGDPELECEIAVFDDKGSFSEEFVNWVKEE